MKRAFLTLAAVALLAAKSWGAERLFDRVIVIGLDGCRPEAVLQAAGPVLQDLWKNGSYTWTAQAVHPTVTQCNFASILTGCVPEKHGIADKKWEHGVIPKVRVQTLPQLLAANGLSSACFLGHEKLYPSESQEKGVYFEHSPHSAKGAAEVAVKYLQENRPDFCFVYMGNLDGAGHSYGWLSPEQLAEMPEVDAAIGSIIEALKKANLWDGTLLMVTSDHGGHGRAHGEGTLEDSTVPVICYGKGVKASFEIPGEVHNYDVAATAAYALGVPIPETMDAKPLREIFSERAGAKPGS